jgi:hypothetical protein
LSVLNDQVFEQVSRSNLASIIEHHCKIWEKVQHQQTKQGHYSKEAACTALSYPPSAATGPSLLVEEKVETGCRIEVD